MLSAATAAASVWANCSAVSLDRHPCTVAVTQRGAGVPSRFGFVSLGTELEMFSDQSYEYRDLTAATSSELPRVAVLERLAEGHVGAVVVGSKPPRQPVDALPPDYLARRDRLRLREVTARQLLQQIALDDMTSRRGTSPATYDALERIWDTDLSILVDIAMVLTSGADRQRYTDRHYAARIAVSRRAALNHLASRAIRSNPLLTI